MSLTTLEKQEIVKNHGKTDQDTGTPEVQIALLTADIVKLTEHFKTHKKDNHSRTGLLRKVNLRRKLLNYLKKNANGRYQKIIKTLDLRN